MAKKRSANKSQLIRDYKEANPSAGPKEIAEAVSKSGISVNAQFVSTVLSVAKKKSGKPGRRGRTPGSAKTVGSQFAMAMPIFQAAAELLKVAGDKAVAKEVIDMVSALQTLQR